MYHTLAHYTMLATTALTLSTLDTVEAQACMPVTLLMTRATNRPATFKAADKSWTPQFDLSTVNTASINGALKFVITETIDA